MKNEIFVNDCLRYSNISHYVYKLLKFFRLSQSSKGLLNKYYRWRFHRISYSHGIEISSKTKIGEGLYIGHPFNITINESTTIGKNCNIHKGVTIGQENRGKRRGTPIIGNNVWIGANAAIVGKIVIGDNVLIAPNTFVNVDIPSNSVVFGNPCIIKHSDKAVEFYVNNKI